MSTFGSILRIGMPALGLLAVLAVTDHALSLDGSVSPTAPFSPPAADAPDPSAPAGTGRRAGFLESVGRWFDESFAGMTRQFGTAWRGTMGGLNDQAGSAARNAADAVNKLAQPRLVTGREACAKAPNGAPDCKSAADTMCKAKGFSTGNSVDSESTENCPPKTLLAGRDCPVEHVVTKAMCQ